VVNDLLDVAADRKHPTKRNRPFAFGELPIPVGLILEVALLAGGVAFAWLCGSPQFSVILALYFLVSNAYSLRLKYETLLDVMVLSALYTGRVLAGGAAANVPISTWLLGFSIFLF